MITQVHFKIEDRIKRQALAKAKRVGISFSAYLRRASEEFVTDDISLAIVRKESLNTRTRKIHEEITRDAKKRRGLSPTFSIWPAGLYL